MDKINKAFLYLYSLLFFVVPLIFFTKTSEIFEFNKIIATYLIATIIAFVWGIKIITTKKFEFKRTVLFWPIVIFVTSQILSTFVSIDTRTSIFGYYSRFNGGLLSTLTYSFLYFAFVNNINKKQVGKIILVTLFSTLLVSIYGIFEHYGKSISCIFVTGNFDVDCWMQDVQLRVFATFGQPNWLAAWLVAVIPLTWKFCCHPERSRRISPVSEYSHSREIPRLVRNDIILHLLAAIFFVTLLFTKSRSGILAFGVMFIIYWSLTFWKNKKEYINLTKELGITIAYLSIIAIAIGTPWTPSIIEFSQKNGAQTVSPEEEVVSSTVLETGGTESGDIRKIVWQGALNTWKLYPLLGSGVETFAFSYYQGRQPEHNNVSEWNYIYNKAHNEYLNFLATTGVIGLLSYVFLIAIMLYVLKNNSALLAGFISILITNFFGFSVVPVAILFFLFPAIAIAQKNDQQKEEIKKPNNFDTLLISLIFFVTGYLLFASINYWRADYYYAKGKNLNRSENYPNATIYLAKAINLAYNEPLYHAEIASSYAEMAISQSENQNSEDANLYLTNALNETNIAYELAPKNTNILRAKSNIFADLAYIDRVYLNNMIDTLLELQKMAPTDVSVVYKIGLAYARGNDFETAIKYLEEAISMKPNYKRARQVVAALYEDMNEKEKAKEHYKYILKYISPNDKTIKKNLKGLE